MDRHADHVVFVPRAVICRARDIGARDPKPTVSLAVGQELGVARGRQEAKPSGYQRLWASDRALRPAVPKAGSPL